MRVVRAVLALAVTSLFLLVGTPAPSGALPVPTVETCDGVWVIIDNGSRGSTSTRCATSFGTGGTALTSAGFDITRKDGMICQINAVPDRCTITMSGYWSYWQARRKADGSYEKWQYADLGADAYRPRRGDAEGWRFGDGKESPGPRPPINVSPPEGTRPATASASNTPVTPPPSPGPATAPDSSGNPVGLIATGAILLVGAAGLGGWWWWKRTS